MSRRAPSNRLRGIPLHDWPDIDRRLWQAAFTTGSNLSDLGNSVSWAQPTRKQVAKTWGVYLAFLGQQNALDPNVDPAQRVTPDLFRRFVATRGEAGNLDTTIAERCYELRMALQAMQPETEETHGWIVRPGGRAIASWLPNRPEQKPVIDAGVLSAWALEVITGAAECRSPLLQAETLRDGLILAILAERAPRLRSLAAMELGANVHVFPDRIHVAFRAEDMKMRNPLAYDQPEHLLPAFRRYLDRTRPFLLQGQTHAALWVEASGNPMREPQIAQMVMRRSFARFGEAFGPHTFRHALATSAINLMPERPGLAAAVLGNSHRVVEQHYARADRLRAGQNYTATISSIRDATRELAEAAFAMR